MFNKQWSNTNVLSSFCLAIPHINDDFIFLHADSLIEIGIYKKLRKKNEIILPFKKRKCGYEEMKIYKILITTLFVLFFNIPLVYAEDCNNFDKLSKEYAKCKSELLKEKTTKKDYLNSQNFLLIKNN